MATAPPTELTSSNTAGKRLGVALAVPPDGAARVHADDDVTRGSSTKPVDCRCTGSGLTKAPVRAETAGASAP